MILNNRIQLFNDNQLVNLCGKVENQLFRQRVNHTQLENRSLFAKYFLCILIAGAGSDDTNRSIAPLDAVELTVFCEGNQVAGALLYNRMTLLRVARHHNIFGRVFLIFFYFRHSPVGGFNDALGM